MWTEGFKEQYFVQWLPRSTMSQGSVGPPLKMFYNGDKVTCSLVQGATDASPGRLYPVSSLQRGRATQKKISSMFPSEVTIKQGP